MIALERQREWWRPGGPAKPQVSAPADAPKLKDNPWAFRALLFFIIINLGSPQSYLPFLGPLRLALLSALAAIGFYLFSSDKALKSRPMPTEMKWVLAIVVWATVTVPFSSWPGGSTMALIDFLKTLVFFWLLSRVIVQPQQMRIVFWTLSAVAAPLALTGIRNYLAGEFTAGRISGVGGLASNANDLAMTLSMILPMTAVMAMTTKRRLLQLAAVANIALSLVCIIVTFSRGGFLGVTLMILAALALCVRRGQGKPVAFVTVAVVVGLLCLPSGYSDRLSTITNPEADESGSAQGRLAGMLGAVDYIAHHPIFGAGLGQDIVVLNDWGSVWHHVHTAYLMYGVDLGVPGMVMFIGAMICAYWGARRTERAAYLARSHEISLMATAIRISLLGFALQAVFAPVAYNFYFYYLAGMAVAIRYCFEHPVSPAVANA
jgi:probable O-glycosylation ligase (exosortase A-associated)